MCRSARITEYICDLQFHQLMDVAMDDAGTMFFKDAAHGCLFEFKKNRCCLTYTEMVTESQSPKLYTLAP
jgi:hypothetical protein